MESLDNNGSLAFLDVHINVNSCFEINCEWYKKPTDTGFVLISRSCIPIQHKKNVVEATFHRTLRSTSIWQNFDKSLKKSKSTWLKNQYPQNWTSQIINDALQKIISKHQLKNEFVREQEKGQKLPAKGVKTLFFLQYRGNISQQFKRK